MAVVALAGCGSEEVTSETPPPETLPTSSSVAVTVAPTSAAPEPTPAPTTLAAASTAPTVPPTAAPTTVGTTAAPTTAPSPTTGWSPTELTPGAAIQGYSGNWCCDDARSPEWPSDPAAPPADGFYAASLTEPWKPGDTTLQIRVQRLELCGTLPADTCQLNDDPHEMGADPDRPRDLVVPLDATTRVVVAGFACWNEQQNELGTGAELGELFTAFSADYAAVIEPLLESGADPYTSPEPFAGGSDDGFVGEAEVCPEGGAGPLRFVHGEAPVLLLQSVRDWDGNSLDADELVHLSGVWYSGGTPTFMFYAGFSS